MVATNIDGKIVADLIIEKIKAQNFSQPPGLALIWCGKATHLIQRKKEALVEANLVCFSYDFDTKATQEEILKKVSQLNKQKDVHGIQIQLPLPRHLNEQIIVESIIPEKDVDGMHPRNVALLSQMNKSLDWKHLDRVPFHIPTTPQGCIELLDAFEVRIKGKNAVVVGRSDLMGVPVAQLLQHRDATVTIVHSKTVDPAAIVRKADIVVAAAGKANVIKEDWLKPGSVVLDAGLNHVPDSYAKKGYVLVGDVDHDGARRVCSQINPVGGLEYMTVAMLVRNTVNSYKRQQKANLRASF